MNRSQFERLQEIIEHIRTGYRMLEDLSVENIEPKYLKASLNRAVDLCFDALLDNLNKVEHDAMHIGIKE